MERNVEYYKKFGATLHIYIEDEEDKEYEEENKKIHIIPFL